MVIIEDFDILHFKARGYDRDTKRNLSLSIVIRGGKLTFYCLDYVRELRDSEWIFARSSLNREAEELLSRI